MDPDSTGGVQNIHPVRLWPRFGLRSYGVHPRAYARGVLWYGVKSNRSILAIRIVQALEPMAYHGSRSSVAPRLRRQTTPCSPNRPRPPAYQAVMYSAVIEVLEYVAADGSSPYRKWFNSLKAQAAAKVAIAITRIEQGNLSNTKSVRAGLHELQRE